MQVQMFTHTNPVSHLPFSQAFLLKMIWILSAFWQLHEVILFNAYLIAFETEIIIILLFYMLY